MGEFWAAITTAIGAVLLAFGGGETYALLTGREPYTGWIRAKLGIQPARPRRVWAAPLFAVIVGGFAVWFIPHIERWLPW